MLVLPGLGRGEGAATGLSDTPGRLAARARHVQRRRVRWGGGMAAGAGAAVRRQGEVLCAVPQVPAAQHCGCEAAARGRRCIPPRQVFHPRPQLAVLGRRTATTHYVTTLLYLTYAASPLPATTTLCSAFTGYSVHGGAAHAMPGAAWATVHAGLLHTELVCLASPFSEGGLAGATECTAGLRGYGNYEKLIQHLPQVTQG